MHNLPSPILVVGLGLLGGSYAAALTQAGYEVGAIDIDPEALQFAKQRGWIAHGETSPSPTYLSRFETVILALYPQAAITWVADNQVHLKSGVLLTDVTGVKGTVVRPIQENLRPDAEFVGAHPMAGREVSGVRHADASLFAGANYIVTPTEQNTETAILICEALGKELGCGRISRLSPEQHDEMIGFVSQLTHCIAVSLMTCKEAEPLAAYTGDSFRDLTRIAKINDTMWSELFLANQSQLLSQMDVFLDRFSALRNALATKDTETMKAMMRLSTDRRKIFDKQESDPS